MGRAITGDPERPGANTHHLREPKWGTNGGMRAVERESREQEAEAHWKVEGAG